MRAPERRGGRVSERSATPSIAALGWHLCHSANVFTPLHQSPLFTRQHEVYEGLGMRAWSEGIVPWRATTCPLLADVEAELIAAFAEDVGEPVTVIDVGAGTGRLGFHLVPKLEARGLKATVVLADIAPSNVRALSEQPQLAALAATGRLTFEVLDALHPTPRRGATVLLAHYLFDSLPHRAFRVTSSGEVLEGLVDVTQTPWAWRYEATNPRAELEGRGAGTFLVPVGAAQALAAWRSTFEGPLLALAADKGVTPRGPLEDPLLAQHESVSAGVDFTALARLADGWVHSSPASASDVFALHAFTTTAAPQLMKCWRERGGRNQVLHLLERFNELLAATPDAEALLGFLETTHDDPDLLAQLSPHLRELTLDDRQAGRLVSLLARAGERHFHFKQQLDVPFSLGITAHGLGALQLAIAWYGRSLAESGAHPSTLLNLALAQKTLGRVDDACAALEVLLEAEPEHPRAKALLDEWSSA